MESRLNHIESQVSKYDQMLSSQNMDLTVRRSILSVLTNLQKPTKASDSSGQQNSDIGKLCLDWHITNYSQLIALEDDNLENWHASPKFATHSSGYNMQAFVKFKCENISKDEETIEFLAVAICIVRGDHDSKLKWPVQSIRGRCIIEGKTDRKCASIEGKSDDISRNRRPRGHRNAPFWQNLTILPRNKLESNFVSDNSFKIKIELNIGCLTDDSSVSDLFGTMYSSKLSVFQESPNCLLLRSCIPPSTTFQPICFRYATSLRPSANYFEVEIIALSKGLGSAGIGVGSKVIEGKQQMPGWVPNTVGFHSDDGKVFEGRGQGRPYGPISYPGDILGCGVEFSIDSPDEQNKALVFFTQNGSRIGQPIEVTIENDKVFYPIIGLIHDPTSVRFFSPILCPMNDFPKLTQFEI